MALSGSRSSFDVRAPEHLRRDYARSEIQNAVAGHGGSDNDRGFPLDNRLRRRQPMDHQRRADHRQTVRAVLLGDPASLRISGGGRLGEDRVRLFTRRQPGDLHDQYGWYGPHSPDERPRDRRRARVVPGWPADRLRQRAQRQLHPEAFGREKTTGGGNDNSYPFPRALKPISRKEEQ